MQITKGMKVVAAEAINFEGNVDDVPEYAIDAVISAKAIVSNKIGRECNLNHHFTEILDTTVAVLTKRGQR